MVTEKRTVFEPGDITSILFECGACGGRQVVPLARWRAWPRICGNCGGRWVEEAPVGLPKESGQVLIEALEKLMIDVRQHAPHWRFRVLFEMRAE